MVLEIEVNDAAAYAGGEQRERVGRVAGEDDGVIGPRFEPLSDPLTGQLICRRARAGQVTRSAVDRRVARHRGADRALDARQRWRAGGVVEVDEPRARSVAQRDDRDLVGEPPETGRWPGTPADGQQLQMPGQLRQRIEQSDRGRGTKLRHQIGPRKRCEHDGSVAFRGSQDQGRLGEHLKRRLGGEGSHGVHVLSTAIARDQAMDPVTGIRVRIGLVGLRGRVEDCSGAERGQQFGDRLKRGADRDRDGAAALPEPQIGAVADADRAETIALAAPGRLDQSRRVSRRGPPLKGRPRGSRPRCWSRPQRSPAPALARLAGANPRVSAAGFASRRAIIGAPDRDGSASPQKDGAFAPHRQTGALGFRQRQCAGARSPIPGGICGLREGVGPAMIVWRDGARTPTLLSRDVRTQRTPSCSRSSHWEPFPSGSGPWLRQCSRSGATPGLR